VRGCWTGAAPRSCWNASWAGGWAGTDGRSLQRSEAGRPQGAGEHQAIAIRQAEEQAGNFLILRIIF